MRVIDLSTSEVPSTLATFKTAADDDTAGRLLATAFQHRRGWTLSMPGDSGSVETFTFEGCVSALLARTGVRRVLILWRAGAR